jgi:hypothetical protein
MKTKTFLWICLIMSMSLAQLIAQNGQNEKGNYSEVWAFAWDGGYWQSVTCGEGQEDSLVGVSIMNHVISHYANGVNVWNIAQVDGEAVSVVTGEKFSVHEKDQKVILEECMATWKFNLVGDKGSHYLGTMTWNFCTQVITEATFSCVPKNGK